ncbi:MAG: 3-oxoadipyl-CoA thiolase, partial [Solirubrobacterales bacterium]
LGREPLARIVSSDAAGVDPSYMGVEPVPATRRALDRAGLGVGDIDLVELNEAFASQVLACVGELGIDRERLNVNGGAIALGHPLGSSGARLLTTLVWEMRRRGAHRGLATMCIGVGQGLATVVENAAG